MKLPRKSLQDRIVEADMNACRWLGDANKAEEIGNHAKAEKLWIKSQFWLDRYNLLTGNGEKAPPRQ